MTRTELHDLLRTHLAPKLGVAMADVDDHRSFAELGLDSKAALEMLGFLQDRLERSLDPSMLFDFPSIARLSGALCDAPEGKDRGHSTAAAASPSAAIAVIGIACRFPTAVRGPAEYWSFLRQGKSGITVPDEARIRLTPELKSLRGGWLGGIDRFDAEFFGITAKEAQVVDPQQRLLLEASWEAFEDAYLDPRTLAGEPVGVFVGLSTNEYRQFQAGDLDPLVVTGNSPSIAANRISYFYDVCGPSMTVDTACSSSLTAVDLACHALRSGDAKIALAGGANIILSSKVTRAFEKASLMAADGQCKTFDDSADGYVRGEGVGLVVLKPLDRAIADGDRIYAVILGTALAQDGRSNGLMAPSANAQMRVITEACKKAGVAPEAISYLEAHGTGTHLGDVVELSAIGRTIGTAGRGDDCRLGSVKSNIGHLEAAAGVAGLIKTALCLFHDKLVPSLNFRVPNRRVDWNALRARVQTEVGSWPESQASLPTSCQHLAERFADVTPRLAGVSSFGFGGTNAHAVLMSPPAMSRTSVSARQARRSGGGVLALTARQSDGLSALARAYAEILDDAPDPALAAVCRASIDARTHHEWRVVLPVSSRSEAVDRLRTLAETGSCPGAVGPARAAARKRLVLVFSGQGYQWTGMGRRLYEQSDAFREELLRLNEIVDRLAGWSPVELMFSKGRAADLARTEYAQPVLFVLQTALAKALQASGVTAAAVIGHSLGEISALHAAGMLEAEGALRILIERARTMERSSEEGAMLSVSSLARADLRPMIAKAGARVTVAAENSATSVVLSGPAGEIEALQARLKQRRIATALLPGTYAFHNASMVAASDAFMREVRNQQCDEGRCPVYSTVTGGVLQKRDVDEEYWLGNMRGTVEFRRAVEAALADGYRDVVELGPHPVLLTHIRASAKAVAAADVKGYATLRKDGDGAEELRALLGELLVGGAPVTAVELRQEDVGRPAAMPPIVWKQGRFWAEHKATVERDTAAFLDAPIALAGSDAVLLQGTIDPHRHAFLRDHQVGNRVVFPAAGFIELFVEAGKAVGATTVSNVRFLEMLPVANDVVPLQVFLEPEKTARFKASINAQLGSGAWKLYAQATLSASATPSLPLAVLDEGGLRARCFNCYQGAPLYAVLKTKGYTYGPSFRLLREVWFDEAEALGEIDSQDANTRSGFDVSPAVLDACFHAVTALKIAEDKWMYLPTSVAAIHFGHTPRGRIRVHAKIVQTAERSIFVDLTLHDANGCCLTIEALELLRTDTAREKGEGIDAADGMFYQQVWKPWSPSRPPEVRPGRWLVFADEHGVTRRLVTELQRRGGSVTLVRKGDAFERRENEFIVSPGEQKHVNRLFEAVDGDEAITEILYGWALDAPPWEDDPGLLDLGPTAIMSLLKAHNKVGRGNAPNLHLLTRLAQPVGETVLANPNQAVVWGFAKAIPFEHPNIRCTRIDLGDPADDDVNMENLLPLILADLAEDQFALRAGATYVPRLRRIDPTSLAVRRGIPAAQGVYVVSGGLGALGLRTAMALADAGVSGVALLGRSPASGRVADAIGQIRTKTEIRYFHCEVTSADAVKHAVSIIEAEMGAVRGVLHLAGILDDGAVLNLTSERVSAVIGPKAVGVANLYAALKHRSLDLFVMYSSVAAILGSPGQSAYMAANAMLDATAHHLRSRGVPAMSINWGPWAGDGMSRAVRSNSPAAKLIQMFDPSIGQKLISALLRTDTAQIATLPFDVKPFVQYYPAKGGVLYFEDVMAGDLNLIRSDGGREPIYSRPQLSKRYVAPSNDIERRLCELWARSLSMTDIGIDDEFFELGGDSVFASQVLSEVNQMFSVSIDQQLAYQKFTVANLAVLIAEKIPKEENRDGATAILPVDRVA